MIMSAILESRGWEVAHVRARGSIACGLAAQLVMRVGPSRAFDGVARGTGLVARLSQLVWVNRWGQVMDLWSIKLGDE
jgi:hypothetical protein